MVFLLMYLPVILYIPLRPNESKSISWCYLADFEYPFILEIKLDETDLCLWTPRYFWFYSTTIGVFLSIFGLVNLGISISS